MASILIPAGVLAAYQSVAATVGAVAAKATVGAVAAKARVFSWGTTIISDLLGGQKPGPQNPKAGHVRSSNGGAGQGPVPQGPVPQNPEAGHVGSGNGGAGQGPVPQNPEAGHVVSGNGGAS